jgi:cytochrome c553
VRELPALAFGIPWTEWNSSQASTPTPAQFADVVSRYVQAIRALDPTTGIIGLGGLGKGSAGQSEWISSVVGENGPNLSAVAIHVYPAGPGFPSGDLTGWFASLNGANALPSRIPNVMGEIRSACSTCHVAILVDEFQTGTQLSPPDTLTGGYLAAYVGTEIAGLAVLAAELKPPINLKDPAQIAAGREVFNHTCALYCHGIDGRAARAPSLRRLTGFDAEDILDIIVMGRRQSGKIMPAWGGTLPEKTIWQLTAFILSLQDAK